ncbi:MAG: type II toxin-antitoxin system PemK/MazF family toxin [Aeriscardovia sp.]|nr:type II toxin-antitoxin system PemK/MazF family toxin [Aeriscardovia sp.]
MGESAIIFRPKRGEIYLCNLNKYNDSEQNRFCPVMVIQADELSAKTATVVVAPLSESEPRKSGIPCHVYLPVEDCLTKASTVLLEKMKTVDFIELKGYCGCVKNERTWKQINKGIKQALGLGAWKQSKQRMSASGKETTCLCENCSRYYKTNPFYRMRRLTPRDGVKEWCDRCGQNLGYVYRITELKEE